jgi:hypothetical protein
MSYSPNTISQLVGSSSGSALSIRANASTTAYSLFWPAAQGAANTVLTNDGSGNLTWVAAGSTSQVQLFTLGSGDITNGYITLSMAPATPADTILLVENAGNMFYGVDFTVTGSRLIWTGFALNGILTSGDNLTVSYIS